VKRKKYRILKRRLAFLERRLEKVLDRLAHPPQPCPESTAWLWDMAAQTWVPKTGPTAELLKRVAVLEQRATHASLDGDRLDGFGSRLDGHDRVARRHNASIKDLEAWRRAQEEGRPETRKLLDDLAAGGTGPGYNEEEGHGTLELEVPTDPATH
jgi:hypothetical protein